MQETRIRLSSWAARWGFALLVGGSVVAAFLAGAAVQPPHEVPSFALQAVSIYRLEVASAAFLGLYLVSMAVVLALHNRGFSEIGMKGIKAQALGSVADQHLIEGQRVFLREMAEAAKEVEKIEAEKA